MLHPTSQASFSSLRHSAIIKLGIGVRRAKQWHEVFKHVLCESAAVTLVDKPSPVGMADMSS